MTSSSKKDELNFIIEQKAFDGGLSFELSSSGRKQIKKISKEIKEIFIICRSDAKILVEGYTDSLGDVESNKKTSLRRAAAIANELADNDVDFEIIEPVGVGPENFLSVRPEAAENNRVEIRVIK